MNEPADSSEQPSHFHAFMTDAERWRKAFKDFSRANRRNATEAENALWQLVRNNKLGSRFRRQHAIERYIVDFICLPAWLILEVDGEYHSDLEQAEYDGGRTADLQELGFYILRFTNEEVLQQPEYVLKLISTHLTKYLPSPESSGSPSPQGEGAGGEVNRMNDTLFHELALTLLPGIGPQLTRQLMSYGGAAKNVLMMPPGKLRRIPGVGEATVKVLTGKDREAAFRKAEADLKKAEKDGVEIIFYTSKRFPSRLKLIPDAPVILYYQGTADLNALKSVALVGTRKNTDYGREQTENIVKGLVPHRPLVVSGLAYGIDIIAHRAALQEGLETVGVMATGLDRIYPHTHQKTAEKMREQGGLLTEFPFGTPPDRYNFPARNRIIAGLADGTVVVEAAIKGGALITAELALSYDRDVLAVPGNVGSAASEGCNALIKSNKAAMYTEPLDLEQLLNWDAALHQSGKFKPAPSYSADDFTADEFGLITVLAAAPGREAQMDDLAWKAQLPIHAVASLLLALEFRGVVRALPGKKFALV